MTVLGMVVKSDNYEVIAFLSPKKLTKILFISSVWLAKEFYHKRQPCSNCLVARNEQ